MKISAYHKSIGDTVKWWEPLKTEEFDKIYSSKVFDYTDINPFLPEWAIRGGTGYNDIPINQELPDEIDRCFPYYSIYSSCDYAIGFLTRGCSNHCRWCVVPHKEGSIRPYRTWKDLVRQDSNKLVLMDNNTLACEYGIAQLRSLADSDYRIDLNQGMDARLVDDGIANILSKNQKQLEKMKADRSLSPEEYQSMVSGNGGKLNPDWVETMMGFPIGWTQLEKDGD